MVDREKNLKKIFTIIFYTTLILGINSISDFQTTHSKYKKDENFAVIYNNQLYKVDKSTPLEIHYSRNGSTPKNLLFYFFIDPNEIGAANDKNVYKPIIPKGCSMETTDENVLWHNDSYTEFKISDRAHININCPVDNPNIVNPDRNTQIIIPVTIREQVEGEDEFIYQSGSAMIYRTDIPEEKPVPTPETDKDIEDTEEKTAYQQLVEWMNEYIDDHYKNDISYDEIKSSILDYIKIYEDNVFEGKELKGLVINKKTTSGKVQYNFGILANFVGYARTKYIFENPHPQITAKQFYFTTENDDTLNEAFEFYMNSYLYPVYTNDNDRELVKKYIETTTGWVDAATFIKTGTPSVRGLSAAIKGSLVNATPNALLSSAKNKFSQDIVVNFDTLENMTNFYRDYLTTLRENNPIYRDKISDSAIEEMLNNPAIILSITKNNTTDTPVASSFTDYHPIYDPTNNKYLMIKVYSDATKNSINIAPLEIDNNLLTDFIIERDIDSNALNVTLKATGSSDIDLTLDEINKMKSIVSILDTYFAKSSTITDDMITKEAGIITLSYSYTE